MFDSSAALCEPDTHPANPSRKARAMVAAAPTFVSGERSSYRSSTAPNPIALLGSAAMVAGLLSAFLYLNVTTVHAAKHDLVTVDLATAPPPPQPKTPPPAPKLSISPPTPAIVTPPPVVPVSAPAPQIATVAAPPPPQAVVVSPAAPPAPPRAVAEPADAGDLSSKMISATPPSYPLESRRKHEQGTVVLMLVLGTDGAVADISVSESSGSERLDKAALTAVRHWRWSPTLRDGAAVMVRGLVKIPFVLKS